MNSLRCIKQKQQQISRVGTCANSECLEILDTLQAQFALLSRFVPSLTSKLLFEQNFIPKSTGFASSTSLVPAATFHSTLKNSDPFWPFLSRGLFKDLLL